MIAAENWIHVEDELPPPVHDVLAWNAKAKLPFVAWYHPASGWRAVDSDGDDNAISGVTWWANIIPPKEGKA